LWDGCRRIAIYEYNKPQLCDHIFSFGEGFQNPDDQHNHISLKLLEVSRQIYAETKGLVWTLNTLHISNDFDYHFKYIPKMQLHRICKVMLSLSMGLPLGKSLMHSKVDAIALSALKVLEGWAADGLLSMINLSVNGEHFGCWTTMELANYIYSARSKSTSTLRDAFASTCISLFHSSTWQHQAFTDF
jgi:hypothetical protein